MAVAATLPSPAHAQQQMWVGFHDDPVLRYGPNRQAELGLVRTSGATVVRTVVDWSVVAPRRPRRPADPFSADYRFADLDELVRNAQLHGLEVLMTVWGTPRWANGGRPPRYLPRKLSDFSTFARALATRCPGPVRRLSVRPLLRDLERVESGQLPLAAVRRARAAGLAEVVRRAAAAGYAAIRSGSPRAQVAIGETSVGRP